MAEKIDIAEFTFNAEDIDKQLEKLERQLFELRQEQKENVSQSRKLQKAMNDLAKENEKLAKDGKANSDQYKKNEEQIKKLTDANFENFKSQQRNRDMINQVSKEYRETSKVINSLLDAEGKKVSSTQAIAAATEREVLSIKQARENNKELLQLRNELDIAGGKNADKLEQLNQKLNENNAFIKANVSEYEKQKIGIGDYSTAIQDALKNTGLFNGEINTIKNTLQSFSPVMDLIKKQFASIVTETKNATAATKGMDQAQKMSIVTMQGLTTGLKLLRLALISTGIGAIVVAFGSLIAYLATTQEGIDKLTSITRPLTAVFQTLLGLFQDLGKQVFDNPLGALEKIYNFVKKNLIETFKNLGDIIAGAFTLDFDRVEKGWNAQKQLAEENAETIKKKFGEVGDAISEAWDKGKEIDRLTKQIEQMENDMIVFREEENAKLAEQELIMRDTNRTVKEREAALKEHEKITKKLIDAEGEILNLQIKRSEIQNSLNDTSRKDEAEYQKLLAERIKNERRATDSERTNIRILNRIRNEGAKQSLDNIKKIQDAQIKAAENELKLLNASQGIRKKDADDQLELARQTRDAELRILDEKLKFQRVSQEEYNIEALRINDEYLIALRDQAIAEAEKEYKEVARILEERKNEHEKFTQERLDFEIETANKILENEKQLQETLLEQGEITKQEYEDRIFELEKTNRERRHEAQLEFEEAERERLAIDLENQRAIDDMLIEDEFERRQIRLERQRQQEIENAEKTGADINLINQKYANLAVEIERQKQEAKLAATETAVGAIAGVLGKESELGKALALSQALINVALGVTKAIAQGGLAGIATGAVVAAAGAKSIIEITKTKIPKASKGRKIKGRSHAFGGEIIEAEGGEMIINKRSSAMFAGLLSQINMAGGGIPLAENGRLVGGNITNNSIIQNTIRDGINPEGMIDAIENAVERGATRGTEYGSQEGIIGLSENRNVQQISTF